ncbi:MAG: hypothetical protein Q9220_007224 [cf. Caloplaca sp. 1 TL-2023]
MHFFLAIIWSLLSFGAHTTTTQSIIANFDDLPSNPATPRGNPVPIPYDKLAFNGFNVRNDGVSIVRSHSANNTISSAQLNAMLSGIPANISSKYPSSPVKSFDLQSVYLGCSLMTVAATGAPQACVVQFKGITTAGKPVTAPCTYSGTIKNPALVKCSFGTALGNVTVVDVVITNAATLPAATVVELDDVSFLPRY